MKYIVIFNPKAGVRNNNERDIIENYLKNENFDYDFHETTIDEGPYEILAKLDNQADTIITCGGDGTISQTIRGMHKYKFTCPLLVLPLGTSNEIAQNLGLKDDNIENILDRLKDKNIIELDYGLINDNKTFTYALTFGNFTQVTYETPQKMKNWLGFRAYLLYGFLSFRKIKTYRIMVSSSKVKLRGNYLFGGISNSVTVGSIFHYDKDEISLSDGKFEVLLIKKPKNVKQLRLILQGLVQNDYSNEMFETFKSSHIKISSTSPIDWNTDGEFAGSYTDLEVKNIQKNIKLIV